jgi:hypothetical protein
MPSKETVQRQRAFGGALGVLVLGFGLTYHFFPEIFHVSPEEVANPSAPHIGRAAPVAPVRATTATPSAQDEINAGPPLTLAPTEVIATRLARKPAPLPEQMSADPPEVKALLERADKAYQAGHIAGDRNSAAALYEQALKLKPDSRAAAQGLDQVRTHLIAQVTQDIAVGDSESAGTLLENLKALPNTANDVAPLEASMKTLLQVRPMLAQAAELLQQDKVDKPAGENALELYRQVQKLDPQNAVAAQGILRVQRVVLDRALAAVAQNDFAGAEQSMTEAAPIRRNCATCARRSTTSASNAPPTSWRRRARRWMRATSTWLSNWPGRRNRSVRSLPASMSFKCASPMRVSTPASSRDRCSPTAMWI